MHAPRHQLSCLFTLVTPHILQPCTERIYILFKIFYDLKQFLPLKFIPSFSLLFIKKGNMHNWNFFFPIQKTIPTAEPDKKKMKIESLDDA